ncbi:MAG: glycosyltransferase family 2 protein [Eubacteriaceae bacterium]|nr:glycosyltransferase family 2 protein [Eubacteriaceae bacterium]
MARKLDILVPIYDEGEEVLKPLLDSLAIQQDVDLQNDVGVIVCCDGGKTELSEEFLTGYPFLVESYQCSHRGVSATRNACLDHSQAEYVAFCDADDMFMNACGLWILFREMEKGFDSLVSVFLEENRVNGQTVYLNREMDSTFVHGKVHRRQYLVDKGIRWNERLTIHEDSYFNILCQNLSEDVKYCPSPFYLWKWRDASVCRHDPKYILKTYGNMLDSNDALVDEFLRRGKMDKAAYYTAFMIFDAYYTMNKPEWANQENKKYRDLTELRFARYFLKHEDLWNSISQPEKMMISNGVRSRSVSEGMLMEAVTIDGWLRHVKGLAGKKKKRR